MFIEHFVYALAAGFIALLGLILLLNLFSLPANWMLVALAGLWKYMLPASEQLSFNFFVLIIGLALIGEALEFGLQAVKAKKYGSSNPGLVAGLVGAVTGAVLCAPLLFGFGALLGALAGAWIGCYLMEILRGGTHEQAARAATGAMIGRFLGTVCKCAVGGVILVCIARAVWPDAAPLFPVTAPGVPL